MNRPIILLILGVASIGTMRGSAEIKELKVGQAPDRFGLEFQEPEYPKGANVALLQELAWFFGGEGDFKKEKTAESWRDLLARLQKAGLPRLATKEDLKVTQEKISNLSSVPVLMVLGHQHPVNTAL